MKHHIAHNPADDKKKKQHIPNDITASPIKSNSEILFFIRSIMTHCIALLL